MSGFSHDNTQGYPSSPRESHWLPALRPDAEGLQTNPAHTDKTMSISQVIQTPHSQSTLELKDDTRQDTRAVAHVVKDGDADSHGDEDDGRLDPAWGFKRIESVNLLDNAQRSSSFPRPSFEDDESDIFAQTTSNGVFLQPSAPEPALDDQAYQEEAALEPTFAQSFDPIQNTQSMLDHRFEEGIPLLPDLQEPVTNRSEPGDATFQASVFDEITADSEDTSFFAQVQSQAPAEDQLPNLERKSTEDVLGVLPVGKRVKGFDFSLPEEEDSFFNNSNHETTGSDAAPVQEVDNEDSKWAAVMDDDDEFLVEDADDLLPDSEPGSPSSFIASLQEDTNMPTTSLNDAGQQSTVPQTPTNAYTPHQPSTSDMTRFSPKAHGNVGVTRPGLAPMTSFQSHLQQPTIVTRAESYADQAKGGYKSPYDLPMELAKPKKRPQTQRAPSQISQGIPPPPRSSSMSSQNPLQSPFTPNTATFGQSSTAVVASPPVSTRAVSSQGQAPKPAARQSSTSSFFEELPITSKPRAAPSGRYTPSQGAVVPPPALPTPSPPIQQQLIDQPSVPTAQISDPYAQFQLRPPERLDPYANVAIQPPSLPTPSATINRYSPAPVQAQAPRPTASPRYSPAPPAQPPTGPGRYASQPSAIPLMQPNGNRSVTQPMQPPPHSTATQPFMPRTSSPLAYQSRPPVEQNSNSMPPPPVPKVAPVPASEAILQTPSRQRTPPLMAPPSASSLKYSPTRALEGSDKPTPPRRAQTQSPSRQMARPAFAAQTSELNNRPVSAYGQTNPTRAFVQPEQAQAVQRTTFSTPELDFEQPQDELQNDPLQRWKGAPVFKFGFGGMIVSSFPRHTPRYRAGQVKPQFKATAGEVKTRLSKDLSILPESVTSFPGPLKGKSKKKDLLTWMSSTITKLESEAPAILGAVETLPDPRKCHEELIILWKIVRIVVEHDGIIENKPEALKAINIILSPEVHAIDETTASQYRSDTETSGIYSPAGVNVRSEAVDPLAAENMRKHLLKGERDQAVWKAADARLWSHALLIASTIRDDHKIWKQVVQEFVRQEVKTIGNNSESLSALYEIFGGNMEESIDQLVPPSARAGLQMVSKVDVGGPTKNALDGLNKWKETLSLVLNNRTTDDHRALATLGSLLANYGRVQAAHICFLFARSPLSPNFFGGTDDPQSIITLLGSDQRANPFSFHHDHNALLLTEAYEFAVSTLTSTQTSTSLPYLAAYKFQHALELADNGLKTEAQAYCDAIASGISSKSKMSPYFNPSLLAEIDDLAKRLRQVPVQSTSWMAKPSVEKAKSSLLSKLSNFVAGEDSDAESKTSATDVGPFAKTSGSPGLSRSGSQTDLYSSYPSMTPAIPINAASSRYAPGGPHSTRSSTDLTRGRTSLDSQRSPPASSYGDIYSKLTPAFNQPSQSPARSVSSHQGYGTSPSRNRYQATPPQPSYMADLGASQVRPSFEEQRRDSYVPNVPQEETSAYMPTVLEQDMPQETIQPAFGGYQPFGQTTNDIRPMQQDEIQEPSHDQPQSYGYGYEPPADTGYVPYQPEPDSDDDSKKPKSKKKSFVDDGDDNFGPLSVPAAISSKPVQNDTATVAAKKKANDEAADAAFRAAAEADATRAKEEAAAKKGAGWLGGWFGGKKADASSLDTPKSSGGSEPKVFKAKLGEDKMKLYYDKDLKKWVNPDDPDSMKVKAATPPPPPGRTPIPPPSSNGPPRSGNAPPPVSVSRASTPASGFGGENAGVGMASTLSSSVSAGLGVPSPAANTPPGSSGSPDLSAGGAALPSRSGLVPPARPMSTVSNASSIDDLIGPATARKGGKGKGAKKGRYVDVMAQ